MVTIRYQVLFSIKLEHDYYENSTFDDLIIVPSEETIQLLRDYKIICRVTGNVLTAMINSEANKPLIPLNKRIVFRFYVSVKNGTFLNFSSLKILDTTERIYYFSNKSANEKNNKRYLSLPVPLYKETETYEAGAITKKDSRVFECIKGNSNHDTSDVEFWRDIVTHQSKFLSTYTDTQTYNIGELVKVGTEMFECLKPNSPTDTHNTSEPEFWQKITEIAYVNNADLVDKAAIAAKTIPGYDANNLYPKKSWVTAGEKYFEALEESGPAEAHPTSDTSFWTEITTRYILEKSKFSLPPNTFAVIDIFNGFGETPGYTLPEVIDDEKPKTFVVRFKNRSTLWKYISQNKSVTGIVDKNSVYTFSNAGVSNEFVSLEPIPLIKKPLTSIELTAKVSDTRNLIVTGLQNPNVSLVKPSDKMIINVFSEIYLNY